MKATNRNQRHAEAAVASGSFRLEDFLPFQLAVTTMRMSRFFGRQYEDGYGLSIPEWRVLAVVGRFEEASPSMVSEWTSMDKVKVSRAAATLVARGLIRQTQDPDDGRARVLRLTRKGVGVYQGAIPLARRLEDELAEGLTKAEWASLRKAIARLSARLGELGAPGGGAED